MKIVSTSYVNTSEFNDPEVWLNRICFHAGILEQLAKFHEVESIEQINYRGKLQRNGVTYHFLNYKKRKLYFPWQLHRYIKKLNPDVVLVNGFIFPLQVMQLRFATRKKIKIIIQNHAERPFQGFRRLLQRQADHYTSAYLFTSHEMGAEWVQRGIITDEKKIAEVMEVSSVFHPIDKKLARSITKVEGNPVFLWVGRLNANKDPLIVVKAFLQFAKQCPSAKLFMIYQEEDLLPQVKALIEACDRGKESIKLVGPVRHQELQDWYNSADYILSGSHHEGGGVAVCEAMSCGCIPVLTNINSFIKMTGPGKCGLLYEVGNAWNLVEVLLSTRDMDVAKERLKVLEQFKNELSFEAIAKKINQVIQTVRD